jgi:RNA polymerase sigma-70 factor (ECF subfamily)
MEEFTAQPKNIVEAQNGTISIPEKISGEEIRRRIEDPKDKIHEAIKRTLGSLIKGDPRYLNQLEDIAQDVSLLVWKNADTFNGGATLGTWVGAIAKNCFFDYVRKLNARNNLAPTFYLEDLTLFETQKVSSRLSPSEAKIVSQLHSQDVWNSVIENISPEERILLEMKFKEGMGPSEISEKMKQNENTIKVKIFRLMQKIREMPEIKKMVA